MIEMKVEKLPEIVKRKHGSYFLFDRDDNLAIYGKSSPNAPEAECFEVFFIKKIDGKKTAMHFNKAMGKEFYSINDAPDIKEKYPKDEDFGKTAWTYKYLHQAFDKFMQLRKKLEIKKGLI